MAAASGAGRFEGQYSSQIMARESRVVACPSQKTVFGEPPALTQS
jgi:hypothetical protein